MVKLKPFGWVFTPKANGVTRIEVTPSPVVFCRDCEEYKEWLNGESVCMRLGSYYGNTKPDDYCSHGHFREGATPLDYEDAKKKVWVEEASGDD
jgi:hypothetical protein